MPTPARSNIYSVGALTAEIKKLLELSYADVWVEGEVSSLSSPPSGHVYFTLKEHSSILKCVLFKNKKYLSANLPTEGDRILVRGRVSVYTARGDVQLICQYIEAAGEGILRRQFDELKNRLRAEGLFDESHKQALPERPRRVSLITSSHGAVLHDIISTLRRRYPLVHLRVYPAAVQGDPARADIIQALQQVIEDAPDVVILARGGGSLEDLQVFNDEAIARAVFECPIPVVSAIGHETDFVITDFVADLRAPTPTAAATLVSPDIQETYAALGQYRATLDNCIQQKLDSQQQRLDLASQRLQHPRQRLTMRAGELQSLTLKLSVAHRTLLETQRRRIDSLRNRLQALAPLTRLNANLHLLETLVNRLDQCITERLSGARSRLGPANSTLQALNPLGTLQRGYSILHNADGAIIKDSTQLHPGDPLRATLARGKLDLQVESVKE